MRKLNLKINLSKHIVKTDHFVKKIWNPSQSTIAGYNKSPRVRGLSFPSSYRDSTFLSIFAVPNNAVFWTTSNLTFTPIRFMYSLKLTDTAPRAPITTGTTMTFRMRQTFAISSFNSWYFSKFSSSGLSFTLSSSRMATSIMTTSLSFLSIKTISVWSSYHYFIIIVIIIIIIIIYFLLLSSWSSFIDAYYGSFQQ